MTGKETKVDHLEHEADHALQFDAKAESSDPRARLTSTDMYLVLVVVVVIVLQSGIAVAGEMTTEIAAAIVIEAETGIENDGARGTMIEEAALEAAGEIEKTEAAAVARTLGVRGIPGETEVVTEVEIDYGTDGGREAKIGTMTIMIERDEEAKVMKVKGAQREIKSTTRSWMSCFYAYTRMDVVIGGNFYLLLTLGYPAFDDSS